MAKRKNLSKKVRFEVFKRDGFKCQYCGKEAPDVVLNVDHIKPVKEGGTNELINLVTSCFDCNSGKGATLLSDDSAVKKQKKQIKELQMKDEQLEFILKWREALINISDKEVQSIVNIFDNKTGYCVNDRGKASLKKHIKKYGFQSVLKAMDASLDQYLETGEDGETTKDSAEKILSYVPRICSNEKKFKNKPYMKDLYYIRGIMRNRYHYVNEHRAISGLEQAYNAGATIEDLKECVLTCKNWSSFVDSIDDNYGITV